MKTQILTGLMLLTMAGPTLAQSERPDKAKFEVAKAACESQAGVTMPTRGERPSTPPTEAEKAKMEEFHVCMSKAGFSGPPRGQHQGHRPPPPTDDGGAVAGQ